VGFIPQSAWVWLEKNDKFFETIWANIVTYAKLLKVAWGAWNWIMKSNKCNQTKKMDAISNYHDSEIIHGWYVCIFKFIFFTNSFCIFSLKSNLFLTFFVLSFKAQQRRLCGWCNLMCIWTSLIVHSSSCNKSYSSYDKLSHQYGHCI
jgi:hypothetical protein